MLKSALRSFVGLAVIVITFPAAADAAYDMSGKWLIMPGRNFLAGPPERRIRLDLTQSGGLLSQPFIDDLGWTGSIDESTGVFHLTAVYQYPYYNCDGGLALDGSVSADGKTFTATLVADEKIRDYPDYSFDCAVFTTTETGTRCGNNQLDAGEECDFGDVADGDCCSSACLIAEAGSICTTDFTECTADLCNASGVCEHTAVPGSCTERYGCGTGECSDGACVVTDPEPAGTLCQRGYGVCTIDTCDGAGLCAFDHNLDCGPCAGCDDVEGCIRNGGYNVDYDPPVCNEEADAIKLDIKVNENPGKNRIRLQFAHDWNYPGYESVPDFAVGDPTYNSLYTVCVYVNDGPYQRPVFGAAISPGGQCDGDDCWRENGHGAFTFKDKTLSTGGIAAVTVDRSRGLSLKGKKENLWLLSSLPVTPTMTPVIFVRELNDYYTSRRCWSHTVTAARPKSTRFRGQYSAVP